MRNKFLVCLSLITLLLISITGCGRKDTADTVIKEGNTIDVYSISEDNKEIIVQERDVEKITDTFINAELQALNVIPTNIIIENAFIKNSDSKLVQIDYSENFAKYINSLTEEEEYIKITCIVNTFLSAYDCEQVYLTSAGETFTSATTDYKNYIKFNSDLTNPYYVEPVIEDVEPVIIDEYAQITTLFDAVDNTYTDNNLLISPISSYASLAMLYDGANGETKELLDTYIDDINVVKSTYASLISKSDFRLNNALFYHKGGTDNKVCTVDYAKALENYKTEIYPANMNLQKTTLDTFNNWVAGKTKNKVTNFLSAVPNSTQLYLVSVNQYDLLFDNYTIEQTFTTEDGAEKQMEFLEFAGNKTVFKNDMATAIEFDVSSSKYKLVCIMPNDSKTKISSINLTELFMEKESSDANFYLPVINSLNNVKFNNAFSSLELSSLFTTNADLSLMFKDFDTKFGVSEIAQINILNIGSIYSSTPVVEEVDSVEEFIVGEDTAEVPESEETEDTDAESTEETEETVEDEEVVEETTEEVEEPSNEEEIVEETEPETEGETVEEPAETVTEISSDSIVFNKKFYYMIVDNETNQIVFLGKYSK